MYVSEKVLRKHCPIELVHRNAEVAQAWADDKLERESAHSIIEALSSQLAMVTRRGFKAALLPDDLLIGPYGDRVKTRTWSEGGIMQIGWNDADGSLQDVIPSRLLAIEQLQEEVTFINLCMDRGPSNTSAMNFLLDKGHPARICFSS